MAVIPGHTLEELVLHWSEVQPEAEAFVSYSPDTFQRRALTRHDLHTLARKWAAMLRQLGVAKGDVVAVALPNCLERVVVDLGIICSGAVAFSLQVFRADGEDLVQALNSSKAKAVVLNPTLTSGAWSLLQQYVTQLDCDITCDAIPHLRRVISCQQNEENPDADFFTGLTSFTKSLQRAHALPSDVAVIWSTSGTTGYSKLVPQSHANVIHIARQVARITGLQPGEAVLNAAPLGWAGGFPVYFLGLGARRVFLDTGGGPAGDAAASLWGCVQRERPAYVFTAPVHVAAVLARRELWAEPGAWRPRAVGVAGQPVKKEVVAAAGRLCDHVDVNYGTTECGVIATGRFSAGDGYRDGLTGRAAFGVELRIVDGDLRDVEAGQKGEVLARSPALYGAYLGHDDAAARAAFTADGWFRTDDAGYLLPDARLVHLGRRSDTITRGAYLCYPGWLEALLRSAPGVAEVCVVPVPDPVLHQEICACVVPADQAPPDELEASLRVFADKLLLTLPGDAQHMAPKFYVFLPSLPLTPTGKVSRKDLGAMAQKRLGLCDQVPAAACQ